MGRARPVGAMVALAVSAISVGAAPVAPGPSTRATESREPFEETKILERSALIAAVLERNPELHAASSTWEAARSRISLAKSLADPVASVGIAPLSGLDGGVRFGHKIEVSQALPRTGTLEQRGERRRGQAEVAEGRYQTLRRELALAASRLFDDYFLTDRALAINAEHVRLLEDFKRVAAARYAAGLAAQQDPLQAEVELAHLAHRGMVLATRREVIVTALNELLHRSLDAPLPTPREPEPPAGARAAVLAGPLSTLVEAAAVRRPELTVAEGEVRTAEAALALAKLDRRPGFRAVTGLNSLWNERDFRWTVGVAVDLPLRKGRIAAGIAEAEAELEAARSRLLALRDRIASEVRQAREQLAEMEHVLDLYTARLIPAAGDQLHAARAGFETGRNSFLALIEAERNVRTVELGYAEALADSDRRLVELVHRLGGVPGLDTLPGLLTVGPPHGPPLETPQGSPAAGRTGEIR
jgi:cobalt-zinc-cadmium efflux system outer membrane protein